jgi:BMFP domain-containing protein YqiC
VLERWLQSQNLVARDEFEAVKEMAANARLENERLASQIEALAAELNRLKAASAADSSS